MKVRLRITTGRHEGKEVAITNERFLVGRSEACQLRSKSESISRQHCIILLKKSKVLIQDLNSRNGTFVNEKRLPGETAEVLKSGDQLRIGKLNFELIIEHGLQAAKKPEVSDLGDAAARIVQAGSQDSRFEAVDVGDWLEEADQIDRGDTLAETQAFHSTLIQAESEEVKEQTETGDHDSSELSVRGPEGSSAGEKKRRKKKQKPASLPEELKTSMSDNSSDAANTALKRFYTGR